MVLNKEEEKHKNDPRYVFDVSHFPKVVKNIDDALDLYNELGMPA